MRLLTDAHALLWGVDDPGRLSGRAAALLGGGLRVLVGEVVLEGGEQVGAELAAVRVERRGEVALEQVQQEALHTASMAASASRP